MASGSQGAAIKANYRARAKAGKTNAAKRKPVRIKIKQQPATADNPNPPF